MLCPIGWVLIYIDTCSSDPPLICCILFILYNYTHILMLQVSLIHARSSVLDVLLHELEN
jgi:hypothetical protein